MATWSREVPSETKTGHQESRHQGQTARRNGQHSQIFSLKTGRKLRALHTKHRWMGRLRLPFRIDPRGLLISPSCEPPLASLSTKQGIQAYYSPLMAKHAKPLQRLLSTTATTSSKKIRLSEESPQEFHPSAYSLIVIRCRTDGKISLSLTNHQIFFAENLAESLLNTNFTPRNIIKAE